MVTLDLQMPHAESLPSGTPHLTINHEAIVDLDSSGAFEGPEKLLEIWFAPSAKAVPAASPGLKVVSADVWKTMLDVVNCKVLSIVESDDVDAYLLSESSMFVFPHKLILKTCGTTTLLWGIPHLLEIAAKHANFPSTNSEVPKAVPYRIFYSRKSFLFPDKQLHPHKSWADEMRYLDKMFAGGSAYMVGKMNGEHWYLYLTNAITMLTPPTTPKGGDGEAKSVPASVDHTEDWHNADEEGDETLEILMTDLDVENAKQFYLDHATEMAEGRYIDKHKQDNGDVFGSALSGDGEFSEPLPEELTTEGHALGTIVTESCGLSEVYPLSRYPDARIDAYQFSPCGFSANGVIPSTEGSKKTHYFTVHVTPEPHCSYASFETNVPSGQSGRETAEIVDHIVNIFKPGRFSVTLFEKTAETNLAGSQPSAAMSSRIAKMDKINGYQRSDRIRHDLDGYDLVFRHFEKIGFTGGSPRLGETYD